jgi:uncharacterized protein YqgV (UPF0045/DUF77 family)
MTDILETKEFKKVMEISQKIHDLDRHSNTMYAPSLIKDFIVGVDLTVNLLAKAVRDESRASAKLKQAEAEAYFDRAQDFLKSRGVRESSEAKKMYIAMDPEVIEASEVKAKAEAIATLLKNKLQELRMAHDSVKKIAYSGDYHNSPNEGF